MDDSRPTEQPSVELSDLVDRWGEESFPASDPPPSWGYAGRLPTRPGSARSLPDEPST